MANNFLPFCDTDTGSNLLTQGEYAADPQRGIGNQPGIARAKLVNKALRQSAAITSQFAQFMEDKIGESIIDDGDVAALLVQIKKALANPTGSSQVNNLAVAGSVAANAMTIAIKTQANADPSAPSPVVVGMRSATITSGVYNARSITSALSIVIPSGQTMGQQNGVAAFIYVYLIDNAGTLELAVSGSIYPENQLVSTSAVSGASTATGIYSTTARSNVPLRLVGRITNTQATAGTWATSPSQIQLYPNQSPVDAVTGVISTTATVPTGGGAYRVASAVGAFTVTVPTTANTQPYIFTKTDTSANAVTISCGTFSAKLQLQNQSITIAPDGSGAYIVGRSEPPCYSLAKDQPANLGAAGPMVFPTLEEQSAMDTSNGYGYSTSTGITKVQADGFYDVGFYVDASGGNVAIYLWINGSIYQQISYTEYDIGTGQGVINNVKFAAGDQFYVGPNQNLGFDGPSTAGWMRCNRVAPIK